jgi:hypothetical protein
MSTRKHVKPQPKPATAPKTSFGREDFELRLAQLRAGLAGIIENKKRLLEEIAKLDTNIVATQGAILDCEHFLSILSAEQTPPAVQPAAAPEATPPEPAGQAQP